MHENSSSVRVKKFLDSTFLMSIVGVWYNKDKDVAFNADGTGGRIGKDWDADVHLGAEGNG